MATEAWRRRAASWLRGLGLGVGLVLPLATSAAAQGLRLAVFGDMPYSQSEYLRVQRVLADINAEAQAGGAGARPGLDLLLHVGDFKGGSEACSDELLRERFEQLQQLALPWLYTPGDNDWTDCHRPAAGRHRPLERLEFLRRLFFADPTRTHGPRSLAVRSQGAASAGHAEPAGLVEHQLLTLNRITIGTLHVVGSDNDLDPWTGYDAKDSKDQPRPDRLAAFRAREAAVLEWIDRIFAEAAEQRAAGVVVAFQANPRYELPVRHPARLGFNAILQRLDERTRAWGRPVLLVHGDFHEFLDDQPVYGLPLLRRVQTFGSPRLHWVRVLADPDAPGVFSVEPRRVVP